MLSYGSLPVTKNPSNEVFSKTRCLFEAMVITGGVQTFFEKVAHLMDNTHQVGHFQKVLFAIRNFSIILSMKHLDSHHQIFLLKIIEK